MGIDNKLDLLGKHCRDIVTGFEGICTSMIDYLYGCETYSLRSKAMDGLKHPSLAFYREQLEVIDDGIRDKVEIPEYTEPILFGKVCCDKVTGVKGVIVARATSLFASEQYVLEYQPEDLSKDTRILWIDEGRLEELPDEKTIAPKDVNGKKAGGMLCPDIEALMLEGISSVI